MTGFTPELVERIAVACKLSPIVTGDDWTDIALAALEASGIAELTEALTQAREALSGSGLMCRETLAMIDAALAKIGGSHG